MGCKLTCGFTLKDFVPTVRVSVARCHASIGVHGGVVTAGHTSPVLHHASLSASLSSVLSRESSAFVLSVLLFQLRPPSLLSPVRKVTRAFLSMVPTSGADNKTLISRPRSYFTAVPKLSNWGVRGRLHCMLTQELCAMATICSAVSPGENSVSEGLLRFFSLFSQVIQVGAFWPQAPQTL